MSEKLLVVGKSVPKIDAIELAKGKAEFADDIKLLGMLHAKILRSPYAHARIKRIDVSKAEELPGVEKVITFKDVPRVPYNPSGYYYHEPKDRYVLDEKVRFVGEPVAVVAAVDEDTAEEALGLIDVEYEEIPAVFDPEEAMKPGAPRIHDVDRNIAAHITNEWGDTEKGFENADYVFEDRYETQRQQHCPLEPHACVATYELGKLTIWLTTQIPFQVRKTLAEILNIPLHRIRVINSFVGGGFGGKDEIVLEPICALLAMKTGKPAKIRFTREEEFCAATTRHPCIVELKTGVKKDGTLVARHIKVILNTGAYASHGPSVAGAMSVREIGLYKSPNVKFEAYCTYTNTPVAGAFRGYGNPQQSFAVESQLDTIAEKLRIDPVELRLKNIIRSGDINLGTGLKIESCGLEECIRKAAERIGWKRGAKEPGRNTGRKRGMGIACSMHNSGAAPYLKEFSSSIVKVNEDGTINLLTGVIDLGTGSSTTLAQIVAEELGMRLEDVTVARRDTEVVPADRGTYASGSIYIGGEAARRAAVDAKNQLLEKAAKMLGMKNGDLEIVNGNIRVKERPEIKKSIGEVSGEEPIIGRATYVPPGNAPSFGAQCVEVEVDTERGNIRIPRFAYAHDVGRAINPAIVEGQIEGGAAMGIGYALIEELLLDERGRALNPGFIDYKIPAARDVPEIEPIIVESIEPTGPFAAKGVGEPALVPTAPAIANAIYHATGIRIKELPITSEKILRAIKKLRIIMGKET